MYYHHHSILVLLLLLHTFCSSSPIPYVQEQQQQANDMSSIDAHEHARLNYYELLCALYNDCDPFESNEVMSNKFKPKRLTSSLFHGIPKFGKRAFVSAFSGLPKFG